MQSIEIQTEDVPRMTKERQTDTEDLMPARITKTV